MCISFALSAIADLLFKNDSFENYGLTLKVKNIYRLLFRLPLVANFVTCRSALVLRLYTESAVEGLPDCVLVRPMRLLEPLPLPPPFPFDRFSLNLSGIRMFLESHLLSICTLAVDIRLSNFLSSYAQPAISLRLCLFFNVIGYCGKDGNRSGNFFLWSISVKRLCQCFSKVVDVAD